MQPNGNSESVHLDDVISTDNDGGFVNNSFTRSINDVDDDDGWVYDGVGRTEPTMDELEECDEECHVTQYPDADNDVTRSHFSCNCTACCYGCRQCLRRAADEVGSTFVDAKRFTADTWRRKCSRGSWIRWARRQFPVVQWLPRYT